MIRRLDHCNKCGEPLRAGICSDEWGCLLDRTGVVLGPIYDGPAVIGRTHIGRMAQPVERV